MGLQRKNSPFYIAFIFLFIHLFNLSPFVESSDLVEIRVICSKTPFPDDCLQCFAKCSMMPIPEFVIPALDCTYTLSTDVQGSFAELTAKAEDPTAKAAYGECSSRMSNFASKMDGALTLWGNKKEEEAKKAMTDAQAEHESCQRGLIKLLNKKKSNHVLLPTYLEDMFKGLGNRLKDAFVVVSLAQGKIVRQYA